MGRQSVQRLSKEGLLCDGIYHSGVIFSPMSSSRGAFTIADLFFCLSASDPSTTVHRTTSVDGCLTG